MRKILCLFLVLALQSNISSAEVYLYDQNFSLNKSKKNVNINKNNEQTYSNQVQMDVIDKEENKISNDGNDTKKDNDKKDNDRNDKKSDLFNIYANAGVGLTGIAVNGSVYFKNFIGIRVGYDFMPNQVLSALNNAVKNASDNITGAKSSFHAVGIDLSIRPFFGSFRIDGGLRIMNYSMSVDAFKGISNPYVNNAGAYGNAKFVIADGVKPYVGLGWDWNPFLGFTIGLDLGVIFTGQWSMAKMDANVAYGSMSASNMALFDANYGANITEAKSEIKNVKKEVNDKIPSALKFWPVIKLSIGWRFNI